MDIESLFAEAKSLLRRWYGKALPNYQELHRARSSIDSQDLASLTTSSPEVQILREEVAKSWIYEYARTRNSSRLITYLCVAVSLIMMLIVGSISIIYNKGSGLLAEMQVMSARQPDRRFGQLERQLYTTQEQLFAKTSLASTSTTGVKEAQSESGRERLAEEASYLTYHELKDLDAALFSLHQRTNEFEYYAYLLPNLETVGNIFRQSPLFVAGASGSGSPFVSNYRFDNPERYDRDKFCPDTIPSVTINTQNESSSAPPDKQKKSILGMAIKDLIEQACRYNLNYTSTSVPSVDLWALRIKKVIDPYASWILPSLYACLGAMIYFMRLLIDPAEPNPRVDRIFHRLALAALAGMMLGLLWEPAFGAGSQFKAVGFGLFTFAFIIGFSIEVFFAFLDRLVDISKNSISKLGT